MSFALCAQLSVLLSAHRRKFAPTSVFAERFIQILKFRSFLVGKENFFEGSEDFFLIQRVFVFGDNTSDAVGRGSLCLATSISQPGSTLKSQCCFTDTNSSEHFFRWFLELIRTGHKVGDFAIMDNAPVHVQPNSLAAILSSTILFTRIQCVVCTCKSEILLKTNFVYGERIFWLIKKRLRKERMTYNNDITDAIAQYSTTFLTLKSLQPPPLKKKIPPTKPKKP